ncbi:glycosyltransferase [Chryseobacterium indoltheticum]|uniref:Colanic acid biosynthesis glycosyltransferase WcaL n=1 Tax=Chryseobacterium indoltheticum TaxID=254 RepID=A0A381F5H1_9FLAO|nr:glycosyltransferase [Chryseobacterium indoltheticum]SIR15213.1 Glycosyltransferase involved in cell wall bisynthesis [Chryseobacterium indoltheticum]SUX41723.1 colanic acid biosynthesis glycosyltransferase WcaL [Chryseobacterium indoltheticum]
MKSKNMQNNNTCCLFNYASHYRLPIYKKIDEELNADFYFGTIPGCTIKKFNYQDLHNFKKEFKTLKFKNCYWYIGSLKLLFKPYENYILTGDPLILSNWIILVWAKISGKKTYFWTHGWYGRETTIKKLIKKCYFGLATEIFLYGEYAKELMIKEGFDENKLHTIYNSLDYEKQILVRDSLKSSDIYRDHFKNNHPVIIYIGRIQRSKKIELAIEAMLLLQQQNLYVNFVILGESKDYDFKNEIERYGLKDFIWLVGACYDEEQIGNYIFNANICVSPGNVGLTAIHSLMYGTPVITHNNFPNQGPEFETIIEEKTGMFFKENNIEDLADKISYLINNPVQREDCYKVIDEKWNVNNQVRILENIL